MGQKRYVLVGGIPGVCEPAKVEVNEAEWLVATLEPGTPIEWEGERLGLKSGVGVFLYSWLYDGVMAVVDAGGRRVTLHPAFGGLTVRRLEDVSRLNQPMTHGEGI